MFGFISSFVTAIGDFISLLFRLPSSALQFFENVYLIIGSIFGDTFADLIFISLFSVFSFAIIYALVKLVLSLL